MTLIELLYLILPLFVIGTVVYLLLRNSESDNVSSFGQNSNEVTKSSIMYRAVMFVIGVILLMAALMLLQ
jgi:preprotein translocase subunit SecG